MSRARAIKAGDAATDRLYESVVAYIKDRGGAVVVIGGVEVQEWPGGLPGRYRLAIHFTGRKPDFVLPEGVEGEGGQK